MGEILELSWDLNQNYSHWYYYYPRRRKKIFIWDNGFHCVRPCVFMTTCMCSQVHIQADISEKLWVKKKFEIVYYFLKGIVEIGSSKYYNIPLSFEYGWWYLYCCVCIQSPNLEVVLVEIGTRWLWRVADCLWNPTQQSQLLCGCFEYKTDILNIWVIKICMYFLIIYAILKKLFSCGYQHISEMVVINNYFYFL